MDRRTFLQMAAVLAGAEALPVKAEDRSPSLDFDFRIQRFEDELLNMGFFNDAKDANFTRKVVERLFEPTKKVMQNEMGIPINIADYDEYKGGKYLTPLPGAYTVIFTDNNQEFIDTFMTGTDLYDLIAGVFPEEAQRLYEIHEEFKVTSPKAEKYLKDGLTKLITKSTQMGIADGKNKRVFLFKPDWIIQSEFLYENAMEGLGDYCLFLGKTLLHELGHVFGLKHSSEAYLPNGKFNVMFAQSYGIGIKLPSFQEYMKIIKEGRYGFSEQHKRQIKSRLT